MNAVPDSDDLAAQTNAILQRLGVRPLPADGDFGARSPVTGTVLGRLRSHSAEEVEARASQALR